MKKRSFSAKSAADTFSSISREVVYERWNLLLSKVKEDTQRNQAQKTDRKSIQIWARYCCLKTAKFEKSIVLEGGSGSKSGLKYVCSSRWDKSDGSLKPYFMRRIVVKVRKQEFLLSNLHRSILNEIRICFQILKEDIVI